MGAWVETPAGFDHVVGVTRERCGDQDIRRQDDLDTQLLGLLEVSLDRIDLVEFEEACRDLVSLRHEEGVHHAATDEQCVDLGQQRPDDRKLV